MTTEIPARRPPWPPSASFASAGIIETESDVDVFAFKSEAGTIQLDAFPDARSPNLHFVLQLYDANGNRIAESNPETALSASISLLVPVGTYFVRVRSSGHGDPFFDGYSSYASLGTYVLSGHVPYVEVVKDPALSIRIGGLALSVVRSARWNAVLARVTVTDLNGLPVPGAVVTGIWVSSPRGRPPAPLRVTVPSASPRPASRAPGMCPSRSRVSVPPA